MFHELGDFLILRLNHMLDQEHFPLLLDKLPAGLTILGPFYGNIHSTSLRYLNLALYFGVDGEG